MSNYEEDVNYSIIGFVRKEESAMSLRLRTALMIVVDSLVLFAALWLALVIQFGIEVAEANTPAFMSFAPGAILVSIVILTAYEAYHNLHRPIIEMLASIIIALMVSNAAAIGFLYLPRLPEFPPSLFLLAFPIQIPLLVIVRLPWTRLVRRKLGRSRTVIVPGSDYGLAAQIKSAIQRQWGSRNVDIMNAPSPSTLSDYQPDLVVLAPDSDPITRNKIYSWCAFSDVPCLVIPTLEDILFARVRMGRIGDFPTLQPRRLMLSPDHALLKRITDILGGSILGLVTLPVALLCAAIIKIHDPASPVIYRQVRVGEYGRLFTLYKFRTMIPNAEAESGPVLATSNDPRITPPGRWLRATRLDELPQLWNVLKGDMSLVGPRPERPEFVEKFVKETPIYALRHKVKPGLTGLAQVLGRYSSDYRDKLRYDLLYVAFASPLLDLRIFLQTARVALFPIEQPQLQEILEGYMAVGSTKDQQ